MAMSYAHVRFPALMLERILIYYAKVVRALMDADTERSGKVPRKKFASIFRLFSVDIDDKFLRVMDAFDKGDGIEHKPFLQAVSERLFPPRPGAALHMQ